MIEITQAIPDVIVLLMLQPEELGAKLLFLLRKRNFQRAMFSPSNLTAEIWPSFPLPGQEGPYPTSKREAVEVAMTEAWAWLEAQGLIVRAPDSNGERGWKMLSRGALRFESEAEFARFAVARLLPQEALHRKIAQPVWMACMRSEFDVAVFQAMKAVEVAVREASGLGDELVGVKLMRAAFHPESGVLTDLAAEGGERQARVALFTAAIGSYKNPQSHRDVNLNDPIEAVEIIMLANHLLRIVDARANAREAERLNAIQDSLVTQARAATTPENSPLQGRVIPNQ
jgi:uncharacterized protein (TIGR02391 family)